MRAPFAYYGGKSGMAPLIASLLPPHRVYLEPFLGSGAVFFAKKPATHEIINDADLALVTFLRVMRDRLDELDQACELTPHSRVEFDAADLDEPGLDDLELARRFWVRVNQSFAKTAGRWTGFSVTTARTQSVPASIAGRRARFAACAARIMQATLECTDALGLIRRLATVDSATYVDPPYWSGTRRSHGAACSDYRVDMGDTARHEELAEVLHASRGAVLLSGYHSPLYDELYGEWDRLEISTHANASSALSVNRNARTEVLWANYDLSTPSQPELDWESAEALR